MDLKYYNNNEQQVWLTGINHISHFNLMRVVYDTVNKGNEQIRVFTEIFSEIYSKYNY